MIGVTKTNKQRQKAGKGHHVCCICGEYIRPERGDKMARMPENQKAHRRCKGKVE